jgi:hypothetical protein
MGDIGGLVDLMSEMKLDESKLLEKVRRHGSLPDRCCYRCHDSSVWQPMVSADHAPWLPCTVA